MLALTGDLDKTSTLEIIAPAAVSKQVTFNGAPLATRKTIYGTLSATVPVTLPAVSLPNLSTLQWVRIYFMNRSMPANAYAAESCRQPA